MPRVMYVSLALWAILLPRTFAADLDDFHWQEPFEDAEAWSAHPEWLSDPSPTASVFCDGQTARFQVDEPERAMKWSRDVPAILLDELPYIAVRYRAENLDTSSTDYLVYLDDHHNEQLNALRLCDATSDGEWHIAVVETDSLVHSGAVHALAVQVRSGKQGMARLWLDFIHFTDVVPSGGKRVVSKAPPAAQPEWTAPLLGSHWVAQPDWLGNPAAADQVEIEQREGTTVFRVGQADRGMKWSWSLPEPAGVERRRYVSFRYRANGVSACGDYALAATGKPQNDNPGYIALIHSPQLICDGRWHTANLDLRKAAAAVPRADGLALQVQADLPGAALEVAEIRFSDSRRPSPLSDAFDWRTGASWDGFRRVELTPLASGRSSDWLRHLRISDWFEDAEATVEGVPFRLVGGEENLATTGVREKGELRIPIDASASEVYLVLLAAMIGDEEPVYGEGKLTAIRDVDRFRLRLEYADGAVDECLPINVANERFAVAEAAQVLMAAADPTQEITALVLCDRSKQAGFAVAAVTLRNEGPRLHPEALEETAAMQVKPASVGDGARMEIEFAGEQSPMIERLLDRRTNWNLLSQPSPLVQLTVDGKPVAVDELPTTDEEQLPPDWQWRRIPSAAALRLGIRTSLDAVDGLKLSACVRNVGDQTHNIALVAPAFGPYRLSESPEDSFYLYPKRGAALDNRPCSYRERYSGLFPVQFIDTFSPLEGRGLVLRTEDTTCLRRHYRLDKNADGLTLAVEYPEQALPPGAVLTSAPATLTLTDGDWRRGLEAYRGWAESWRKPISPRKPWFREVFNFRQRFLWAMEPLYDPQSGAVDLKSAVAEARREFGGIDYLHLFDWGVCGQYGRIYGRTGDYSPYEYLKGGREALHSAIAEVQADGAPVGLYIEGYLLQERGKIGGQSGAQWQLIGRDGKPRWWPDSTEMFVCPAVEPWREIQASTYETKVAELGVDGMYIDQFGFSHDKDCWSAEHGHESPSDGVVSERDTTRLIRERIEAVKPNVALYTEESPVDVTTQYQDGSFSYAMATAQRTSTRVPLNLLRFALPDFKTIEILYCDKPTGSWATGVKWVFFNGEAIWLEGPAKEWFEPETRAAIRKCYAILHKHRDAFTTLKPTPLTPTLLGGVFANAFPVAGKTVYTLYNTRHRTVRGEMLRIPAAEGSAIDDEWYGKPAEFRRDGAEIAIHLEIGPHDVGCVVVRRP